MPEKMIEALSRANLRPVVVDDLGSDALIFRRYGLALLDAAAIKERADVVCAWLSAAA